MSEGNINNTRIRTITREGKEFDLRQLPDGFYLIYRDNLTFPVYPMAPKNDSVHPERSLMVRIGQLSEGSCVDVVGPLEYIKAYEEPRRAA